MRVTVTTRWKIFRIRLGPLSFWLSPRWWAGTLAPFWLSKSKDRSFWENRRVRCTRHGSTSPSKIWLIRLWQPWHPSLFFLSFIGESLWTTFLRSTSQWCSSRTQPLAWVCSFRPQRITSLQLRLSHQFSPCPSFSLEVSLRTWEPCQLRSDGYSGVRRLDSPMRHSCRQTMKVSKELHKNSLKSKDTRLATQIACWPCLGGLSFGASQPTLCSSQKLRSSSESKFNKKRGDENLI